MNNHNNRPDNTPPSRPMGYVPGNSDGGRQGSRPQDTWDSPNPGMDEVLVSVMPRQPEIHTQQRRGLREQIAAALLGTAALGIGVVGPIAGADMLRGSVGATAHGEKSGSGAQSTAKDTAPDLVELSATLKSKLDVALSEDICKTKVTTDEVAGAYQGLFGKKEKINLTLPDLTKRTDDTIKAFEAAKSKLEFGTLPKQYAELEKDALGARAIPLERYQKATEDFYRQYGINAVFDWKTYAELGGSNDAAETEKSIRFSRIVLPVKESKVGENQVARLVMLDIMRGTAALPTVYVKAAGVKYIAFGDVLKQGDIKALGSQRGDNIVIDVANKASRGEIDAKMTREYTAETIGHEIEHAVGDVACGVMLDPQTRSNIDPAYTAFNPVGFQYGLSAMQALEKGVNVSGVTTLETAASTATKDTVALKRPYSAYTSMEDKATLFGELMITPNDLYVLTATGSEAEALREKAALLVARYNKAAPGLGDYLFAAADVSRVRNVMGSVIQLTEEEIKKVIADPNKTGSEKEQEITTLGAGQKPYGDLIARMDKSLGQKPAS